MNIVSNLRQRSDYTHKFNIKSGRHGWLRLTPAYSVKVVEEILSAYGGEGRVLDPFCGSGTTALCAARSGFQSATTDINPFLIWLARTKTRIYSKDEITSTRDACNYALESISKGCRPVEAPPIHKIERWWSGRSIEFLCALKGALNSLDHPKAVKDLLDVAFCRTLIKLSNAAFNHQSMSFKDGCEELDLSIDREAIFLADVSHVLAGCEEEMRSESCVLLKDARQLSRAGVGKFDLVITSPPYANRMSYIRELRPYMYWLGYLKEAREAGELDWQAIGGTWGVATSRLSDWVANNRFQNEHLSSALIQIAMAENKHASTLSNYVHKYCEDIFAHLGSITDVLNEGARVHYIVGNSTFYGTLVSVEQIYADMMKKVGFRDIEVRAIRKRNSKKELVEFDVSAEWRSAQ